MWDSHCITQVLVTWNLSHQSWPTHHVHNPSHVAEILSGIVCILISICCMFLWNISVHYSMFTILCHVAAILNGIPGIVVASAPAALSAAWFPPHVNISRHHCDRWGAGGENHTNDNFDDRHPGKSNCHFHLSNAQQCGTRGEYQNYNSLNSCSQSKKG